MSPFERELKAADQAGLLARLPAGSWLWRRMDVPSERRTGESGRELPTCPKISLVVPVYNTPTDFLVALLLSVREQTYANWELCLGNASDAEHGDVARVIDFFAGRDARIRHVRIAENGGISRNTNAALEAATGEVVALLDHDDLLHPSALFQVARAIAEQGADFVYTDEGSFDSGTGRKVSTNFKPDYSPDLLKGVNYICHLTAFTRRLLERAGGAFRAEYDGSQDHELFLRLTSLADKVVHVPELLYFWRAHAQSTASSAQAKPYVGEAGRKAVQASLAREGRKGTVELLPGWGTFYRVRYEIERPGRVSVVIPTRDHCADLRKCLDSIFAKTTWPDYEIVVLDNGSKEPALLDYYRELEARGNVKVVPFDVPFNYSRINNHAVAHATGEYIVFLNNDTEVITPGWLEEMLMYAQRPDMGAVGVKLLYPDDTIQHAGVVIGFGGIAGHTFIGQPRDTPGYAARGLVPNNYSAVTAACLMMRRDVFDEIGGFDESFAVAFNDIDLCMRVRATGRLVVWTPFAELYHFESKSRGYEDTPEKQERFRGEIERFQARWGKELAAGDPYYNPNLALDRSDFAEKPTAYDVDEPPPPLPDFRKVGWRTALPWGCVCAWQRRRFGRADDVPLLFYKGFGKRLRRLVKFVLPYGVVSKLKTR